jgi:hypothetical protein
MMMLLLLLLLSVVTGLLERVENDCLLLTIRDANYGP